MQNRTLGHDTFTDLIFVCKSLSSLVRGAIAPELVGTQTVGARGP